MFVNMQNVIKVNVYLKEEEDVKDRTDEDTDAEEEDEADRTRCQEYLVELYVNVRVTWNHVLTCQFCGKKTIN